MAELKIATKAFCNTLHAGSFSGDTTQCPTKSEILSAGLSLKSGSGTYADNQLVPEDHIEYLWWEYTFSVTPESVTIPGTGGSRQFNVTSYKVKYSNSTAGNRVEVDRQDVSYDSTNNGPGNWDKSSNTISFSAGSDESEKNGTITWTQSESNKTDSSTYKQEGNTKSYGKVKINSASATVAKCSGGTVNSGSVDYEQPWGWSPSTSNGGVITSGLPVSWTSVSIPSLGTTTTSSITYTGKDITVTVKGNGTGNDASLSVSVNQEANPSSDKWDPWEYTISDITVSGGSGDISYSGGTRNVSADCSGSRNGTRTWCSGSSQPISDSSSPSVNWSISGTGFSLSGTTVTASQNNGSRRCCTVTASYPGATSKTVQICQQERQETTTYTFKYNGGTLNFSSSGGNQTISNVVSQKHVSINGGSPTTTNIGWKINTVSGTGFSRYSDNTVRAEANSSTSSRKGTANLIQNESELSNVNVPLEQSGKVAEYNISILFNKKSILGGESKIDFLVSGAVSDSWTGYTDNYYYSVGKTYNKEGNLNITYISYDYELGDVSSTDSKTFICSFGEFYLWEIY